MQRMLEDLRARGSTGATRAGFSVTVVATLALGIGVASAAISLLHALVLRPLDERSEGLVAISLVDRRGRASQIPLHLARDRAARIIRIRERLHRWRTHPDGNRRPGRRHADDQRDAAASTRCWA